MPYWLNQSGLGFGFVYRLRPTSCFVAFFRLIQVLEDQKNVDTNFFGEFRGLGIFLKKFCRFFWVLFIPFSVMNFSGGLFIKIIFFWDLLELKKFPTFLIFVYLNALDFIGFD